jgi:sugar phosphate isomerase/epimerase
MNVYQFGWCSGIGDARQLKETGFDYIECSLAAMKLEDEEQYGKMFEKYAGSPLPVRAVNIFFPGDLKVVGPEVDEERVARYVAKAADTLHRLGVKIAVFGSGKARMIPDGWDRQRGEEQIVALLGRMADEFAGSGVTIVIEPLNRKESNVINSVGEAVTYAKLVNREPIRALADFYHMDEENDPLNVLTEHKEWIKHIHIADTGRLSPSTGKYPYEQFAGLLKQSGYSGMISAECKTSDPAKEWPASLQFMKRVFE